LISKTREEITMTAKTANELIGLTATIQYDGLKIAVKITDAKFTFGHDRFLIEPITGSGSKWVDRCSIHIEGGK
jgi:hypothetical protein